MDFSELGSWLEGTASVASVPRESTEEMTLKERFRRTMFFLDVPSRPNFEFGYWDRTIEVWHDQGLPNHVTNEATAYDYFGIENWPVVNADSRPEPICEYVVLEDDDDHIIYRDEYGCTAEINKHGDRSIPHYLDFPVKDRATWEPFRKALDPNAPRRQEALEASLTALASQQDAAIGIYGGSLVGVARNLVGFEGIAVLPYEDPDLFRDMIDAFGHCAVTVLERALSRMQIDFAMGWEDICFNQGPVVSPDVFCAVVGPWYRRIADLLTAHGCCVYTTDTDGNINPIVDTFLDNGLTTMFPVEVHGGSDPCALRDKYGKRIKLWGGVDKCALIESKDAIDKELLRLRPYVEQGGFIPSVDHRVPADVPLNNYLYYLDRKRELFGVGGTPKY